MRRRIVLSIVLGCWSVLCGTGILWSYQWPVEPRILSVFAQGGDGFERGIQLSSSGEPVKPIDDGELVFYSLQNNVSSSLPYALGNFVVLQHGDALRSLYAHLESVDFSEGIERKQVQKSDPLGKVGLSGATSIPGMSLFVYDLEARQFVNPFLLLPPVKDTSKPVIRNVQLEKKGEIIPLPAKEPVPKGTWEVTAELFDLSSAVKTFWPMGIYKVGLYLNGQESFLVAMDTLKEEGGITRIYPSKGLSYQDLYNGKFRMKLGSVALNPGVLNLEIVARDFAGNERNQVYRFRVE
ncbi:MAG: hypothetical protein Kow009_14420 [Spirochaetales bacterium]